MADIELKFRQAVETHKFRIDMHVKEASDHLAAARKLSDESGVPFGAQWVEAFSDELQNGDYIPHSIDGDLDGDLVEELTGVLPWDPSGEEWDDSGCSL